MNSELATRNPQPATHSDNEVLVRVEGVSKKFCRSLKKSLWYGLCDIAGELSPFARHGAGSKELGGRSSEARGQISEAKGEPLDFLQKVHVSSEGGGGDGGQGSGDREQGTEVGGRRSEDGGQRAGGGLRDGEFWAVNDVSFELRRGECLGLIGHNGAGKTTLLKMLNGLIKPDAGRITMRGRVGALIALGAGFNPILTGRENIYINGSVLGLSKKEIDGKIDEIIDFAEIGEFIDTPVMNYSSGMNVRLGFSVAANLINPDILILDEVLAVGDDQFRLKCLDRIGSLLASGVAGILVTHQMMNVERTCTRCNVMSHGRTIIATTDVQEAVRAYLSLGDRDGGSDVEVINGPGSFLIVKTVRFDEEIDAVRVDCTTAQDASTPLFVTYRVFFAGNELFQGSTREQQDLEVSPTSRSLIINVPLELRRLGNLQIYLGLYDAESRKPLVLIKDLTIPAEKQSAYNLKFSTPSV